MLNSDSPAGRTGGPPAVPVRADLPEKMRVYALAKLIGRTSREVLAALGDLGVEVRSAQSSIDRKAAERVTAALAPGMAAPEVSGAVEAELQPPAEPEPAPVPLAPVFAPPAPLFQPPTRPARTRRRAAAAADDTDALVQPPAPMEDEEQAVTDEDTAAENAEPADDEDGARRRRRRGRRGRGRGRGGDDDDGSIDEQDDADVDASGVRPHADAASEADAESRSDSDSDDEDAEEQPDDENGDGAGSRRRRRRRRRRGSGDDTADAEPDPPGTVTRVRQPRERPADDDTSDGVQSVRGSTRLEAKRQRRRDGRDAGRRRVPILSESEFLARRESVDRAMVVRERGDRVEIGVLEDDILVEHFIASGGTDDSMVGNIYLGRVQNVLPSMEAAFVDIGRGRNAVLYAGEVDWDAAGLGGKARRIEQALSSGDSVLVQVTKNPIGHKGARLTTQVSLAGRFLVYVPSGGAAGISRKLPDVERKRLKDMLKEIVPSEAGVIIRTASEGVSHEALERDVRRLQAQWEVIRTKSEQTGPNKPKAPALLYEEPDLLIKAVRDQFNEDFSRLVVQGADAWDTLDNYVGHVAPELADRLHRHVGTTDVFAEYRIDEQLLKALDRKVWLPSGGTLVIDRTEAMTVIDVNTGKFTGSGGNLEETVTRNNLEAAEEVVRQLRLRDIGGIIVVDFIDMVLEANRDLVLRRLTECLARDRTRHQVAEVTSLGLVQMTRKRVGGGLLEHFSTPCEHCHGRGLVITADPVLDSGGDAPRGDREVGARRPRGGRGRRVEGELPIGVEGGRDEGGRHGVGPRQAGSPGQVDDTTADPGEASVDVGAPAAAGVETAVAAPAPVRPTAARHPVLWSAYPDAAAAGGPSPAVEPAPPDVAADVAEEVVAERSVADQAEVSWAGANGHGSPSPQAPVSQPAPPALPNGQDRAPRRRRGRVTRTAGAPTSVVGDAPAGTVVRVPAARTADEAVPVAVPSQPEPAPATRARRARRAASRPAGPPAVDAGEDRV